MPEKIPCPTCLGEKTAVCTRCGGTGWVEEGKRTCFLCRGEKKTLCPDCLGKGEIWTGEDACSICKGKGGRGCVYCRYTGILKAEDGQSIPCDHCNGKGISICEYCAGKGYYDQEDRERCMRCHGTGVGLCLVCAHIDDENYVCPECGGTKVAPCIACDGTGKGYSLVNAVEDIYGTSEPGADLSDSEREVCRQKVYDALTSFGLENIDPDEVKKLIDYYGIEYLGSGVIDLLENHGRSFSLDWKVDPAYYVPWINKSLQIENIEPMKHELDFAEDRLNGEITFTWGKKNIKIPFEYIYSRYGISLTLSDFIEAINELIEDSGYGFVAYDTWEDSDGFIFIQNSRKNDFISKEIMDGLF